MSLLDRALNFAQKAYNYVVNKDDGDKSVSKNSKKETGMVSKKTQKPISVMNEEGKTVGKVGDALELKAKKSAENKKNVSAPNVSSNRKNSATTKKGGNIQKAIEAVKLKIQQKCQKFGISYSEAEDKILSQMEFSYEEFRTKSPEEQLTILCCIDFALGLYIRDTKRPIHRSVDKISVIGQTARNIKEAQDSGAVKDIEEFDTKLGDVNKELKSQINENADENEYAEVLEKSRLKYRAAIQAEKLAEIRKCNGDKAKIAEIERKYDARLHAFEAQRQIDFAAHHGSKRAHLSIYLRSGKDFSKAHAAALQLFEGKNRVDVADSFTHDFEMRALSSYFNCGDRVSSDEYAESVSYTTQYMSEAALDKFQQDAYEFRKKVENGEISAPYMTDEDFTKESVAIGVGITNNKNISSYAKADLLNKWDRNAKEFADYCYVKEAYNKAVNNAVSGSPIRTQEAANIRKILIERYDNDIEALPRAWKKRENKDNQTPVTKPQKASEATLKAELKTKTVSDIKKIYNNSMQELAGIVLKNDIEYRNRIDDILDYLNCFSGTDIGIKIAGCSTSTISKIIQAFPEKSKEILDVVAPMMCFTGKEAVERIVEERRDNAAA